MVSGTIERERRRPQRELERRVEETYALLRKKVGNLSRGCPPHLVCEAARKDILELIPHCCEALDALTALEARRGLTDEEQARRRAFRMLL